nr:hypothetical protein [Tanacetum cinerariifolium]
THPAEPEGIAYPSGLGMYWPRLYWRPVDGGCCTKIEGCGFIWTAAGIV